MKFERKEIHYSKLENSISSEPESLTEIKAITHYTSMGALFVETKI